jgi:hypothetical protein
LPKLHKLLFLELDWILRNKTIIWWLNVKLEKLLDTHLCGYHLILYCPIDWAFVVARLIYFSFIHPSIHLDDLIFLKLMRKLIHSITHLDTPILLKFVKKFRYFHLFIHPLEIGIVLSFWSWWKDHCSTTNALWSNEQQHLMVKERWEKKMQNYYYIPHYKPTKKMSSWNETRLQRLAQMF